LVQVSSTALCSVRQVMIWWPFILYQILRQCRLYLVVFFGFFIIKQFLPCLVSAIPITCSKALAKMMGETWKLMASNMGPLA
jgi:hypothetical protein